MESTEQRRQQILSCITQFASNSTQTTCKLKRFLRRFERDAVELEDIMQDALLEALKCSESYEARSSPQTWLFGLAANVARNHVAKRVRSIKTVTDLDAGEFEERPDDSEWAESVTGSGSDETCKWIEFRQFSTRLEEAIDTLPVDIRITFDLACMQELPYREVASTLCIPVGTVRSRVNRARCLLKSAIA